MDFGWNEIKRAKTLQERGLDFARAGEIFAGLHVTRQRTAAKVVKRGLLPLDSWTVALW
jgi:uncharacterized DUF497 family protein